MKTANPVFYLKKYFPLMFLMGLLAACANPPDYPIEPTIEFMSVSKDTMRRSGFQLDTTFITLSFTDGDGDIGHENNEVLLYAQDSRYDSTFILKLGIPLVPELGSSNGLKGEMTFRAFTSCCNFPPSLYLDDCNDVHPDMPYDEFTYDIYIEDRAGNRSNTITTTPIYIRCFE